ncbi:CHAP domain-containing protein [Streptococcus dentapri]|uniref:CHAP domain-containing protein n=1 Tax=Streptococcus dentapri TaxID=573564 RepID=A0ABV8D071_9STRE
MKKNKLSTASLLLVLLLSNLSGVAVLAEGSDSASSPSSNQVDKSSDSSSSSNDEEESKDELKDKSSEDSNDEDDTSASSNQQPETELSEETPASSTDQENSQLTNSSTKDSEDESKKPSESQTELDADKDSGKNKESDKSQSSKSENPSQVDSKRTKVSATPNLNQPIWPNQSAYAWPNYNFSTSFDSNLSFDTGRFDSSDLDSATVSSVAYVEHWSGDSAYTHNLLSHRYGITAEQLDGFLQSTGIAYDSRRINGTKLLEWEKKSGLDVRAIVAIAIAESSLGTQGVAASNGANMFGYGAFDFSPSNAQNYNDESAISKLTSETIVKNKNLTFKVQDDKAKKLAAGQLNSVVDGGVYFTDTSDTGKRRAQTMQDLDRWIDQHGGTPEIPAELRNLNATTLAAVPDGFSVSKAINANTYIADTYPWGECTWYVYNRAKELGYSFDPYMGNGGDWQLKAGYETTHEPKVGYAVSFAPGQAGADGTYGHVAIVEEVKEDGSILISESNAMGRGVVSYRTFNKAQAAQLTYVIGKNSPFPYYKPE